MSPAERKKREGQRQNTRETERRNSNNVRKTCLVLFSLAGKRRVQMKAGLPQKEGEEGDLEELCAINAYIP